MNDTPKTDKEATYIGSMGAGSMWVKADFAKTLERELNKIATLVVSLSDSPMSLMSHMEAWAEKYNSSNPTLHRGGTALNETGRKADE